MIKEFKKWCRTKWNVALGFLLAQLGIVSCGDETEMYGCPNADFRISITVKDEAGNRQPSQKIIIRQLDPHFNPYPNTYNPYACDTVMTDLNGNYTGNPKNLNMYNGHIRAVVNEPVDESLSPDSVDILLKQTKKGDGDWYQGTFSGSAEIKLKKK